MMKKAEMLGIAMLGMGTGAFLYSYCEKHPMKVGKMKRDIKNMVKDFQ